MALASPLLSCEVANACLLEDPAVSSSKRIMLSVVFVALAVLGGTASGEAYQYPRGPYPYPAYRLAPAAATRPGRSPCAAGSAASAAAARTAAAWTAAARRRRRHVWNARDSRAADRR